VPSLILLNIVGSISIGVPLVILLFLYLISSGGGAPETWHLLRLGLLGGHELAGGDELDGLGEVILPTTVVLVMHLVMAVGPFVILRVIVGVALREDPVDGVIPGLRRPLPWAPVLGWS
jgi:hypothetical protein